MTEPGPVHGLERRGLFVEVDDINVLAIRVPKDWTLSIDDDPIKSDWYLYRLRGPGGHYFETTLPYTMTPTQEATAIEAWVAYCVTKGMGVDVDSIKLLDAAGLDLDRRLRGLGLTPTSAQRAAMEFLERKGYRFLVDFGIDNCVSKANDVQMLSRLHDMQEEAKRKQRAFDHETDRIAEMNRRRRDRNLSPFALGPADCDRLTAVEVKPGARRICLDED